MSKPDRPDQPPAPAEGTASLLARARSGDREAENRIVERYWAHLRHWAHGRLPLSARERADTDDLVQITLLKTLDHLGTFEPQREGAFTAYLHQVLLNQVRDEIRRARRRPERDEVTDRIPSSERDALDRTTEKEFLARYEAALAELPEEHRKAVLLRVELGYSYAEIAKALGRPSANATRMLISRALARLAEILEG